MTALLLLVVLTLGLATPALAAELSLASSGGWAQWIPCAGVIHLDSVGESGLFVGWEAGCLGA